MSKYIFCIVYFTNEKIKAFFEYFGKNICNDEISCLIWEKKWNLIYNNQSKKLIDKALQYRFIFKFIPFIKEIFICNNIAFWCSNNNSDIDLFVVTSNNKIWTSRILLTFLLQIFWLRRYWNNIKWRFCLSFFATEFWANNLENIQLEKNWDPYLAIWTSTLIPILNNWFYEDFKKNNKWIKDYWIDFCWINSFKTKITNSFSNFIFKSIFFENLFIFLFKNRAINKMNLLENKAWIIISSDYLKFHSEDIRPKIKKFLDF